MSENLQQATASAEAAASSDQQFDPTKAQNAHNNNRNRSNRRPYNNNYQQKYNNKPRQTNRAPQPHVNAPPPPPQPLMEFEATASMPSPPPSNIQQNRNYRRRPSNPQQQQPNMQQQHHYSSENMTNRPQHHHHHHHHHQQQQQHYNSRRPKKQTQAQAQAQGPSQQSELPLNNERESPLPAEQAAAAVVEPKKKTITKPPRQRNQQPQRSNFSLKRHMSNISDGKNDISRRDILTQQLLKRRYECMVCCYNIKEEAAVWSCQVCFSIFHLICIKKWASAPSSKVEENSAKWRCPGCQTILDNVPAKYTCFCTKKTNPEFNKMSNLVPHSCGEVCAKPLALTQQAPEDGVVSANQPLCTHKCTLLCHPGPCPPCEAMITRKCNCSKVQFQVKCSSQKMPMCSQPCEKTLNCGIHKCSVTCCNQCPPCSVDVVQTCFSHGDQRTVKCGSTEQKRTGQAFSCEKPCGKQLACGNHTCSLPCHEGECPPCASLPSVLRTCPCSQTLVRDLLLKNKIVRTSCLDPIPCCDKTCGKPLHSSEDGDSVHTCEQKCHTGPCPPCTKLVERACRCGREHDTIECHRKTTEPQKLCKRRCTKKKSCGRHVCNELCCPDKADSHLCTLVCNRTLDCNNHRCELLCHRGSCPRCLVASFEERICECGSTIQYPPIRCGSKPLECHNVCIRNHECTHPVTHSCHFEEKCPPCTYLTSKMCMGGHEMRNNIPCYLKNVSCGRQCGKPLPCGHKCLKTCHTGPCQLDDEQCKQPCPIERPLCVHACAAPCHEGKPCPDTVCQADVVVRCKCGRKSEHVKCGQRMHEAASRVMFENLACELKEMLSCKSIDLSSFKDTQALKKKQAELECDDECLLAERNRKLAQALDIDPSVVAAQQRPKPIYSDFLKNYARDDASFVTRVEKSFEQLVAECNKPPISKTTTAAKSTFSFPVMKSFERKFIHELAPYYGLETQSYEPEPSRNVTVYATKDKCFVPSQTLTQLTQEYKAASKPSMPHVSNTNKQLKQTDWTTSGMKVLSSKAAYTDEPYVIQTSSAFSLLALDDDGNRDDEKEATAAAATVTKKKSESDSAPIDYFDMTD